MAEPTLHVIPTSYQEVLLLMRSDSLRTVEQAIAAGVGKRVVEDYVASTAEFTLAEMIVSGMTVAELGTVLNSNHDAIIRFGISFLRDEAATDGAEEYPEGEEQDPAETVEVYGLGVGFGITYAIYYHFLANRTPSEFLAFLKNRRIPGHAKFERELRRVFETSRH